MQSTTKSKITTAIIVAVLLVIAFMLGGIAPRSHQRAKYRTTVQLLGYYDSVEHYADGEHYSNVTADKIGEYVAGAIECIADEYKGG